MKARAVKCPAASKSAPQKAEISRIAMTTAKLPPLSFPKMPLSLQQKVGTPIPRCMHSHRSLHAWGHLES